MIVPFYVCIFVSKLEQRKFQITKKFFFKIVSYNVKYASDSNEYRVSLLCSMLYNYVISLYLPLITILYNSPGSSCPSKPRGPMTREEYEKQQSVVRRVFDPDTGRHRYCIADSQLSVAV